MLIQPFNTKGLPGTEAIVVSVDLEGFSKFFTQQDVHLYAPDYLNTIYHALHCIFKAERPYWYPNVLKDWVYVDREPDFVKFTGDGAIYIWTAWEVNNPISLDFKFTLMNDLWFLKKRFDEVLKKAQKLVPLVDLPKRIRIGITRGTVYGLTRGASMSAVDYIGFCINLAVRLQNYCREIGFVASGRLGIDDQLVEDANYKKIIAKNIKGFGQEIVYVDQLELENLDKKLKNELFT